jgi:hypothetical protein
LEEQEEKQEENKYVMPDKAYDVLKWVGLVVCPALATLTLTVGNAVGWPDTTTTATIITGVGTFIGACIGISAAKGGGDQ